MTSQERAARMHLGALFGRPDRRHSYRIDAAFQTRFRTMMLAFSVLILLAVALLVTGVLHVVQNPESVPTSPWVPGSLFALALGIGLSIFYVSDRISHRYCGPIRRISNTLEAIQRGERPAAIHLRKNDEFHELAAALNATLKKLDALDETPR